MLVCSAQVICWNHSHSQQIHTDTGVLRKCPVAKTAQITCHCICMHKKVLIYSAKWLSGYRCLLERIVNRTEGCQRVSGGVGACRRCWQQHAAETEANTSPSSRFCDFIAQRCDIFFFVAGSVLGLVSVVTWINLIYLNDFNESYVYLWKTCLCCNCEIKKNSLEELKRIFMCFWVLNLIILITACNISANYHKVTTGTVVWYFCPYRWIYFILYTQHETVIFFYIAGI